MKKYLSLGVIVFISCHMDNSKKLVVARYEDGKIRTIREYKKTNHTSVYKKLVYLRNGKLFQTALVEKGCYIGNKATFFENQRISQIDSLFYPQKVGSKDWSGQVTRFYANGHVM